MTTSTDDMFTAAALVRAAMNDDADDQGNEASTGSALIGAMGAELTGGAS